MNPSASSATQLSFKLETQLEWDIAADPEWSEGVEWGKSRPGHPEGKVIFHIRDVLNNVDRFSKGAGDRSNLRLIALIHDTFKYKAARSQLEARKRTHGWWAREFAERYVKDTGVLEVIDLHDEAYKASLLLTRQGNREGAERRARELIARLGNNIDLFMRFYLCDNRTGDKSAVHYEWFGRLVEEFAQLERRQRDGSEPVSS